MESFHFEPHFVVLATPGVVVGPKRWRCMICQDFFPMAVSTWNTLHEMRRDKLVYMVMCHGCLQIFQKVGGTTFSVAGISDARTIMGYQPDAGSLG